MQNMPWPRRPAPHGAVGMLLRAGCVAGLWLGCATAQAAGTLWAYEGFQYAAGADVAGQAGGTGWADVWRSFPGESQVGSGLGYTDGAGRVLATTGGAMAAHAVYGSSIRYTQQTFGTPGSTVWLSFLQRNIDDVALAGYATVGLGMPADQRPGSFAGLALGPGGSMRSGVGRINSSLLVTARGNIAPLQSVLHVLRIDFDSAGDETLSLWRNPLLGADPGAPDAAANFGDLLGDEPGGMSLFYSSAPASSSGFVFDELRIGSSYAAVTPLAAAVPEPQNWHFLALGLAMLSLVKRRRPSPNV